MRFSKSEVYKNTQNPLVVVWWTTRDGFPESEAFNGFGEIERIVEYLFCRHNSYMKVYPLYEFVDNLPGIYDQYVAKVTVPLEEGDYGYDPKVVRFKTTEAKCVSYTRCEALELLELLEDD